MTPVSAVTEDEARALLDGELAKLGLGPASTFTVRNEISEDRLRQGWWSENIKPERSEEPRKVGYLRGYIRIAGNGLLLAGGLPLDGGHFLWMDRAVIKCMERDGYLRWRDGASPHFEITPKGAILLSVG